MPFPSFVHLEHAHAGRTILQIQTSGQLEHLLPRYAQYTAMQPMSARGGMILGRREHRVLESAQVTRLQK